ncbi:MAG: alpha/beta hydrolase [Actinomycetota bacterium]|jgi:acetyl esterase/lipase
MTARILAVSGPGLDGTQLRRWATELAIDLEVRPGDPAAVLRNLPAGLAGVVIAPGVDGFDAAELAAAVADTPVPVVAVDPGNLRKAGVEPESTRLVAAGACVIYGRGEDTARHALRYLARRRGRRPDTLAYGPEPGQEGDLWLPAGAGPHPVAVLFHGGFWYHAWERDLMDGLALDLARRGIAAWNAEYRRVGAGGGWPATGQDAARATDHLVALAPVYDLDLGRVAAIGHSAGAQLALWVAARGRRGEVHPTVVVGLATIADLEEAMAARTGGGSVARLLDTGLDGADDRDREVALAEASPRAKLPIGVPQLLVHAVDDPVVPLSQTTTYAEAARAAGDEITVMELERGGHFDLIDPASQGWATVACALQARLERR